MSGCDHLPGYQAPSPEGAASIHVGGIWRCCHDSARRHIGAIENAQPGALVVSDCCRQAVVLGTDGVWRADHERSEALK